MARSAVVSGSRNAAQVLAAGGIAGLFDARACGVDAARLALAGKPEIPPCSRRPP